MNVENIIGKKLGNYQIDSELSRKAKARTLLARDLITQELVVIKLLLFNDKFEWEDLEVLEREAKILENLTHPQLPSYIKSFDSSTGGYFGFAQTYIDAPNLEQHLKAGRTFTESEVKKIALQTLLILIYLHEQNPPIIHGDIKPSNILFNNRTGKIYLVNFGSVKTTTYSFEGIAIGTYGYMAPERFEGVAVPASDLYSLGATLIHYCTGADLPHDDLKIATNLSTEFINWLEWLTQPSLEKRLHSARQAIKILEAPSQLVNVITKPSGSKIQLTKNVDSLDILIPPPDFDTSLIFIGLFAIAWNAGILAWTVSTLSLPYPISIPLALFSLPFWGVGGFMVYWILFCLFGKTRLQLDQNKIFVTHKLFGAKVYSTCSQITYIETPSLIIHTGAKQYQIRFSTEVEREWLACEVNDWLTHINQD
jgi:serine/threonine protein kinase